MKQQLKWSLIVSVVIYLVAAFVYWDLFWVELLPDFKKETRAAIAIALILKEALMFTLFYKTK